MLIIESSFFYSYGSQLAYHDKNKKIENQVFIWVANLIEFSFIMFFTLLSSHFFTQAK